MVKFIQWPVLLRNVCTCEVTQGSCCSQINGKRFAKTLQSCASTEQTILTIVSGYSALQSLGDMTSAVCEFAWIAVALEVWILRRAKFA